MAGKGIQTAFAAFAKAAEKGMQTVFESFSKAEGSQSGKISPDGIKKWFKEADVIATETGITEADVDAAIAKTSKDKNGLEFAEIKECVDALAKEKKVEVKDLIEKLASDGPVKSVQQIASAAGVIKDEKEK